MILNGLKEKAEKIPSKIGIFYFYKTFKPCFFTIKMLQGSVFYDFVKTACLTKVRFFI